LRAFSLDALDLARALAGFFAAGFGVFFVMAFAIADSCAGAG
jgi:hypothetical protein